MKRHYVRPKSVKRRSNQTKPKTNGGETFGPDVFITDEGSLFLFGLLTNNAEKWVEENVEPGYQKLGNGVAVEHRYANAIGQAMINDGLSVRIRL